MERMINAINAVYPTGNLLLDVIFSEFTVYKNYLLMCSDKHVPDYMEQEDVEFYLAELGMYITGYNNYDTWECIERNSLRVMRSCTHFEVSIFRQRLWTFF